MDKPFDMEYVLNLTKRNALKAVDLSIEKTSQRLPEFENDIHKSAEVFKTLMRLYSLRNLINGVN